MLITRLYLWIRGACHGQQIGAGNGKYQEQMNNHRGYVAGALTLYSQIREHRAEGIDNLH